LLLGLAVGGASLAALQRSALDPDALADELARLGEKKERVRENLRVVKRQQRQVSRDLAKLDDRLIQTEARLHGIAKSVRKARVDLGEAADACKQAEERLVVHRDTVAERLVAIYKQKEVHPLEVLLQATTFADFANRLYLLNQIVGRDAELLADFESAHTEAEVRRASLVERERMLRELQERIELEKGRAAAEREATTEKKRRLLRDRAAWERALAELEADSRAIETMLQRLERTPEGQARLVKPWNGKLKMPVQGRISSGYGYRTHPIFRVRKMHTGIDIAAASGTAIKAAASGTVVFSGRWGGYGNCVIVDHGGGLATLYGHCSRIAVKKGQAVEQGETVGYVGSTGLSTGPHLHFEVRKNGRPVNPKPYL
jgi:murein DD-endopeptidase MepM/ murein hydrolase activator NlpD